MARLSQSQLPYNGNPPHGVTDDTISDHFEGRIPPYDATHETRRDLAADRLKRLRSSDKFYVALANLKRMSRERHERILSGKDGVH